MATWTYSDWDEQTTNALRLARLLLHIHEVSDYLAGFQSQGAANLSGSRFASINDYLRDLRKERDALRDATGEGLTSGNAPFVQVRPKST